MKSRVLLPLFLAVIAGLGCAMFMLQVVNKSKQVEPIEETVAVLVAAQPLDATQEILETMVRVKRLPTALVPDGHFQDAKKLVGRVLRTPVPAEYPVTEACLQPEGTLAGFDSKIPHGYRASTIKVDKWSSVSGFVFPGSHVDVIAQVQDTVTRKKRSRTILQNVAVAAVGSVTSRGQLKEQQDGTPRMDSQAVTLFLTPREVEILHEANAGRLTLALRSGSDDQYYEEPVVKAPVINPPVPVLPAAEPDPAPNKPRKFVTWEYQGNQMREITYVLVDGVWQRQNSEQAYPGEDESAKSLPPLPMLKMHAPGPTPTAIGTEPQDEEVDEDEVGGAAEDEDHDLIQFGSPN